MDTLYDEAAGDYLSEQKEHRATRAMLDTCLAVNKRHEEREGQYAHELENCQGQLKESGEKVKRLRVWAWISRIGLGLGAVFAVKELVDLKEP